MATSNAKTLTDATWLRDKRGFSVIALDHPKAPNGTDPSQAGKLPIASWKIFQIAKATDDNLFAWFGNGTPRNLAIVTGAISGIVVIDCDTPAAEVWADAHLPPTPMMTLTSKGTHRYYRHPGVPVSNKARVFGGDGIALDVRGDGGYVVAPGSLHHSGALYTRVGSWPPVDQLPVFDLAWLTADEPADDPQPAPKPRQTTTATTSDRDRLMARARAWLAKRDPAIEGQAGDQWTFTTCCAIVRDFGLDPDDARVVLGEWNQTCSPPWSDRDLEAKIAGALKYGNAPFGTKANTDRPGWNNSTHNGSDPRQANDDHAEPDAAQPANETEPQPVRWKCAADAMAEPSPEPIVEGIAWADSLSVLVGESTAGKTFVLLDLAAAISADLPWHGRRVQQGSVVYLGFEGHVGLRLKALREVAGQWLQHVYVVRASDPISPVIDRDRAELPGRGEHDAIRDMQQIAAYLAESGLPPVRLVIVDTVRASLSGSEDSSEAASAYLRAVRRIMAHVPGAGCLLAHHSGWQDGETKRKRERGSSAFRGNVDGTLYLEAGDYDRDHHEARLTLTSIKVRDGEALPPLHLVRRQVCLPGMFDRWGHPVTSCLVVSDPRSREDREAEQAAVEDAETRSIDIKVLRVICDRPDLTSVEGIRLTLAARKPDVLAAMNRLVSHGWVTPPAKQRLPYTINEAGIAALREVIL